MDIIGIRKLLDYMGVETPPSVVATNGWVTIPCPLADETHDKGQDRHPSFGIKVNRSGLSSYHCFSCKQKGKLYQLPDLYTRLILDDFRGDPKGLSYAMSLEGDSLVNGPEEREIIRNYNDYVDDPLEEAAVYGLFSNATEEPRAVEYLKSRGVTLEAAEKIGLLYDDKEIRIVFPVRMPNGKLYGMTGRSILSQEVIDKSNINYPKINNYFHFNKSRYLLGAERLSGKPVLVVEGLIGYASLISHHVDELFDVVALMGSAMSKSQANILINNNQAVYLLLDNDSAGVAGTFGVAGTRGALGLLYDDLIVYVPQWPEGKKDPDELTQKDIAILKENTYPYVYTTGK